MKVDNFFKNLILLYIRMSSHLKQMKNENLWEMIEKRGEGLRTPDLMIPCVAERMILVDEAGQLGKFGNVIES